MNPTSVLAFRPKTTAPCATTPFPLDASEEGAFGRRIAAYLSPRDGLGNREHFKQSATGRHEFAMRLGIVWAFGPDSVGKSLHRVRATKELPFHELRLRGAPSRPATILKAASAHWILRTIPVSFSHARFIRLHFISAGRRSRNSRTNITPRGSIPCPGHTRRSTKRSVISVWRCLRRSRTL